MKTEVTENIFEQAWDGFKGTNWRDKASVTRFVQEHYKPYDGDESFLAGPTERTLKVKKIIEDTKNHYEEVGFPFDTDRVTSIDKIPAGYIDANDKELELIYGMQNSELFRLNFMPRGGLRVA